MGADSCKRRKCHIENAVVQKIGGSLLMNEITKAIEHFETTYEPLC